VRFAFLIARYENLKVLTRSQNPNAFRSQTATAITTTKFRIDLMAEAIGIYVLISQSPTPTTISTITIWIKGMLSYSPVKLQEAIRCPVAGLARDASNGAERCTVCHSDA